ncbi:MAG: ribosome hibernation-promoting factor, HPF/YfiA family [Muribaculaceae bacterium]
MEVRIQAIHFEIAERLTAFINKKAERLTRHNPSIAVVDVTLKVVKPETAMNKEAIIKINTPQHDDLVASKTADSFEEAVDLAIEALERQLEKRKDRK